ncbi:hypothetical protein TKK_0011223 [Trichogramma kaykai]
MSSKKGDLFHNLFKAHLRAAKEKYKDHSKFNAFIDDKINLLNRLAPKSSRTTLLDCYLKKAPSTLVASTSNTVDSSTTPTPECFDESIKSTESASASTSSIEKNIKPNLKRKYSTPSQDQTKPNIAALEGQIASLTMIRDSNIGGSSINQEIKQARSDLKKNQDILKTQIMNAESQKKFRLKEKKMKPSNKG